MIQGFIHMSGGLAEMAGRLGSAGSIDTNTYTWPLQHGGLSSGTSYTSTPRKTEAARLLLT